MQPGQVKLSRRQLLAATGAVGTTAVAAGAGTEAFFSDTESFKGNRAVAGELDLKIAWKIETNSTRIENNLPGERTQSHGYPTAKNDAAAPVVNLADIKPGDQIDIDFKLVIDDNPGYVSLVGAEEKDMENARTEPERDDDFSESIPADEEGELDEFTEATISYVDSTNEAYTASIASVVDMAALGIGIPLDGEGTRSVPEMIIDGKSPAAFPGSTSRGLRVSLTVPRSLGNVVQADSYQFALGFYAEQARHNSP